ncbi:MAG: 4-hydroxy-tetrahydrodipicolinate synthase [Enterobacterales bacterium]|jgi:4-hydroxy-tetrahydrodipicolinate synthase
MFKGSIVALVTPMAADGSLDIACLRSLVDWHIESGTVGIVIMGTTGESINVTDDEYTLLLETVVEHAKGRIKIIAGTGNASTSKTIQCTQLAEKLNLDACLIVTPYYNKPTQEGLYQHFKAVAESSSMPQLLYNVPGRTAVDLLPETVARLAEIDNIVGIKEATGSLERLHELMVIDNESFVLLSGDDPTALQFMQQGGSGVISVTANVAPRQMADMCNFALNNENKKADTINDCLSDLHNKLFVEPNPTAVKFLLNKLGRIPTGIRLPLLPLSKTYHKEFEFFADNLLCNSALNR